MSEALSTLTVALEEFEDAKTTPSGHLRKLKIQQSAEKMWLAVCQATDHWLLTKHHFDVGGGQEAHTRRDDEMGRHRESFDMQRDYRAFRTYLHGDVFYDGHTEGPAFQYTMAQAVDYVEQYGGD